MFFAKESQETSKERAGTLLCRHTNPKQTCPAGEITEKIPEPKFWKIFKRKNSCLKCDTDTQGYVYGVV